MVTVVGCMTHSSIVLLGRQGRCEVMPTLLLEQGTHSRSSLALLAWQVFALLSLCRHVNLEYKV